MNRPCLLLSLCLVLLPDCRNKKTVTVTETHPQISIAGFKDSGIWHRLGPFGAPKPMADPGGNTMHGCGTFLCVDVHPENPMEILAGHASAGLFKTSDGGKNWEQKLNLTTGVTKITRFRKDSKHLLACTGTELGSQWQSGYGLLESKDGGETWTRMSLQFNPRDAPVNAVHDVVILDSKEEKILLAVTGNKICQSEDRGLTWNTVYTSAVLLKGLTADPNDKNSVIAFGKDLVHSRDGGRSWQSILNEKSDTLLGKYGVNAEAAASFSYARKHRLYIAVKGSDCRLYSYETENNRFSLLLNNLVSKCDGAHFSFFIKPENDGRGEQLYLGTDKVYVNMQGSFLFTPLTDINRGKNYVHNGINGFYTDKSGSLYVTSAGGIDKSPDGGSTWRSLTNYAYNLDAACIYGFDKSPANLMMCGSIETGVLSFHDGEWHCSAQRGEAGRALSIDDSASFAVGMAEVNYFTKNAGNSFEYKHAGKERVGYDFRMSFIRQSRTFYLANTHLYKKPEGKYFEVLTPTLKADFKINAFWVDPSNEKNIWIGKLGDPGTTRDKLLYSGTGGLLWKDIGTGTIELASNDITDICVDPSGQMAMVLRPADGYSPSMILLSDNPGTSFKNITRTLPGPNINTVIYAKGMWVCGTSQGVYAYVDNAWRAIGNGFPPVAVSELRYYEREGTLYASTFGRGILGMRF